MTVTYYGPYHVETTLGAGGMGAVYAARHATTGDRVAVKVIASSIADQERFRRRFATEVETLKKLEHVNIVRLIGYGEEHGQLFYSMELVEGQSLQQRLAELKRLEWREALGIGIQVASALKHAHDLGVIHRDLKPANLMLTSDGLVKLTDFGIAKLFGWGDITAAGSVLGTADFMAPEQAGDEPVTGRTDLYSLGSVLYACLAGRPPFTGRRLTAVLHRLRYEEPPRLDVQNPDVPAEIVELVHDLLAKDPKDRPSTALVVKKRMLAIKNGLEKAAQAHEQEYATNYPRDAADLDTSEKPTLVQEALQAHHNATSADEFTHHEASNARDGGREQGVVLDTDVGDWSEYKLHDVAAMPRHFRTVDDEERRAATDSGGSREQHDWLAYASIAGTVLLLVLLAALGIWMIQPPSADELYQQIAAAREIGDVSAAESAAREFLQMYPDDPRAGDVQAAQSAADVEVELQRLTNQARRLGGIDNLDPPALSFVEAMQMRDSQPAEALRMLQSWQDVYGNAAVEDREFQRLQRIVATAVKQLEMTDLDAVDTQAAKLREWFVWGREHLDAENRIRFYSGLLALYGEKKWAEPTIAEVREALEELRKSSSADVPSA